MLVIHVRKNETFTIGDDIRITILRNGSHGGGIRVGIEAPKSLAILREGVQDKNKLLNVEDIRKLPQSMVQEFDDYRDSHGGHTSGGL